MVELIAYTQDTAEEQVVLDLYGDEVIPLKYNIESIVNPDELSTSYSKQFDLPATKNNNRFFKAYYDVTTDGNFNPYKKVDVIVRKNSIEIFKGILQLYEISYKAGVSSYTVNVFSSVVGLFDEIKDKTINDIDFSDLTHYYTLSNIADLASQSSINNVSGAAIPAKVLYYGWCNWGMVTDGSTQNSNPIFGALDDPANMSTVFRPWVQLKYIWDKIWEGSTYNYSSDFIDGDEFKNLYMDNSWGDDKNRRTLQDTAGGFLYGAVEVKLNADFTPTTSYTDLVYQSEIDPHDLYNNATGFFTAVADNTFMELSQDNFRIKYYSANDEITVRLVHNSTHPLAPPNNTEYLFTPSGVSFPDEQSENIAPNYEIYLNNGESFHIEVKKSSGTHASTKLVYQYGSGSQATNATRANLTVRSGNIMDIQSNLVNSHGKIKQLDFIKAIMQRFNLVVDIDKNNDKNIIIEPYVNWIDDGSTLDWSNKVDNEEYKIEVPDNYRRFILSDTKDDADLPLTNFDITKGRIYGTHIRNNTEIDMYDKYDYDFSDTIFSPTIFHPFSSATHQDPADATAHLYPITVPIPYIYGEDAKKIGNMPRILHYSGIHDIDINGASPFVNLSVHGFNDNAEPGASPIGTTSLTDSNGDIIKIPTLSPYYDDTINSGVLFPAADSLDINYGIENYYALVGNNAAGSSLPTLSIYQRFWHRYLTERYSKGVKILKINADLDAGDIYNLAFNDKILIKGQAYYILSVEHYPNTDKLTKLELLRFTHNALSTCNAVGSINATTGIVLDTNDNPLDSYCCQLYGYNFTAGTCYQFLTPEENDDDFTSDFMMMASASNNNFSPRSGSNFIMGGNNNLYNARMNLVAGADNNLTNAARSAAIGDNHEVTSDHAVATGMGAIAERSGEMAHGYSSTRGRAQCSTLIFTGTTTDANYTEIYIDGDSAKKFTVDQDNDSFIGIEANVLAQRRSNHDSMHKYQNTTFKVEGGVGRPAQVGSTSTKTNNKDTGVSSWNNRFTAGADYIKVEVKGESGATVDWTVILYVNEMRL